MGERAGVGRSGGLLIWVSPTLPEHGMTWARPTSTGSSMPSPPPGPLDPDTAATDPLEDQKQINTAHARLRDLGERAQRPPEELANPVQDPLQPSRATTLAPAIHTLILTN